jgi:glycogen(starch) synthase
MTLLSRSRLVPSPALEALSLLAPYLPDYRRALAANTARYDVVHGFNICFEGMLWPALRFSRRTDAGFAVTPLTHLGESPNSVVRHGNTMRHQMALLSRADAVFAETQLEAAYISRHSPGARVHVMGSGVNPAELLGGDADRFRATFGVSEPFVYYIGTAAFDKGTVHLVEAMRALWNDGARADLVIAGPSLGAFDAYFQGLPADVRARCHRVGVVSEQAKRDLIAASTLFAMPSRTDSFGITYLEAWVCGKPVIGARAGGVPDVVSDGQDGFLVPFGDVSALAGRIRQLLADADLRQRLGESGRRKVAERYTWDVLYPRLRDELAATAQRPRGNGTPNASATI